jgi:hypothetical protein
MMHELPNTADLMLIGAALQSDARAAFSPGIIAISAPDLPAMHRALKGLPHVDVLPNHEENTLFLTHKEPTRILLLQWANGYQLTARTYNSTHYTLLPPEFANIHDPNLITVACHAHESIPESIQRGLAEGNGSP